MLKFIIFVVGLALGFSGGIYYGVNHPNDAAAIEAAQKAGFQKVEHKVQNVINPPPANPG